MKRKKTVFLTGATGLLGSYLLKILLENGHKVYALARRQKDKSAKDRVLDILRFWDYEVLENANKLIVLEGDITKKDLGLNKQTIELLQDEIEEVFHCAAATEFNWPLEKLRRVNVGGTKHTLDFALMCKGLRKVNYISTAYIIGDKKHTNFKENMLDLGQKFNNNYEQSKFEAELLVKKHQERKMKISIFRLSMVISDFKEGKIPRLMAFYIPLHFIAQGIYDLFPGNLKSFQNLINVDIAAEAIVLLAALEEEGVYHVVSPSETTIDFFMKTASDYFGFKLPKFIPVEKFNFNKLTPTQKYIAEPYISYFNYTTRFSSAKTRKVLKKHGFEYPEIDKDNLIRAFKYCKKIGFINSNFDRIKR